MNLLTFEITGSKPILQHNPASMGVSTQGKLDTTKKIPTPEEEAKAGRYLTPDGQYFQMPCEAFKRAFVSGGVGRRIDKRAATSVLRSAVFPAEDWVTLLDPKTKKPLPAAKYEIDSRRVSLPGQKGAKVSVIRSRPKLLSWACNVVFEVDDVIANHKVLEEIGNMAGRMVGVGDYRPEKGGPFGRFTVKLVA